MPERSLNLLPDSIDEECEIGLRLSAGSSKQHEPALFIHLTVPFTLCNHTVGRLGRVEGFEHGNQLSATHRPREQRAEHLPSLPAHVRVLKSGVGGDVQSAVGHRTFAERSLNTAEVHR